mmetsp:Transcript_18209/g.54137  ORF Transcript_18209/g.54137 Transcript_18209/m.54137 type:complete len:293 (-) Transcript_18209:397-1275(-)
MIVQHLAVVRERAGDQVRVLGARGRQHVPEQFVQVLDLGRVVAARAVQTHAPAHVAVDRRVRVHGRGPRAVFRGRVHARRRRERRVRPREAHPEEEGPVVGRPLDQFHGVRGRPVVLVELLGEARRVAEAGRQRGREARRMRRVGVDRCAVLERDRGAVEHVAVALVRRRVRLEHVLLAGVADGVREAELRRVVRVARVARVVAEVVAELRHFGQVVLARGHGVVVPLVPQQLEVRGDREVVVVRAVRRGAGGVVVPQRRHAGPRRRAHGRLDVGLLDARARSGERGEVRHA